jgi:hypothetical protein
MAEFQGLSLELDDRQPITQRTGLQGASFELDDRAVITQRTGFQGLSFVLSDQQPFKFLMGFNAINIENPDNEEQWFETTHGMKGVDIELDNPNIGRAWRIKK